MRTRIHSQKKKKKREFQVPGVTTHMELMLPALGKRPNGGYMSNLMMKNQDFSQYPLMIVHQVNTYAPQNSGQENVCQFWHVISKHLLLPGLEMEIEQIPKLRRTELVEINTQKFPLHMNEFYSQSTFISLICSESPTKLASPANTIDYILIVLYRFIRLFTQTTHKTNTK